MLRSCKMCGSLIEGVILRKRTVHCQSCSSQLAGANNKRHGMSETREYAAWTAMRERCNNPTCHKFHLYGGRGIKVCERWDSFESFYADMGPRPKGYSIERVDNDGSYEPSNCKWATKLEQNRNRRNTYTPEEDRKIREGVALGLNFRQLALFVGNGKSRISVQTRTYRLGLKSGTPPLQKITDRTTAPSSQQGNAT